MEDETIHTTEQEQAPPVEEPTQETPPQPEPPPKAQPEPEPPAVPTLAELLAGNADYQSQYDTMLDQQKTQWENESNARMDALRVDWTLAAALKEAGARNDKAVLALIDRDKIKVEGETVTGVTEQLEALRKSDPYLFHNNGGRPYFSTGSTGGNPGTGDDAVVASRYKNNPFYHG